MTEQPTTPADAAPAPQATQVDIDRDPAHTWVTMYHPELPDQPRSVVTEESFHMLWAGRGWVLLTEDEARASETLGRTVTGELSAEDQAQLAAAQGEGPGPGEYGVEVNEVPFDPNAGAVADAQIAADTTTTTRRSRATATPEEQ